MEVAITVVEEPIITVSLVLTSLERDALERFLEAKTTVVVNNPTDLGNELARQLYLEL